MLSITEYHERTKHQPQKYANGPDFMDWQNQPNPFRFYHGAESISLNLLDAPTELPYHRLFEALSGEPISPDANRIAGFLELALGLSARKKYGDSEWFLRINPSSGNLHPTECYLLLPDCGGIPACIAHYNPLLHTLEIRSSLARSAAERLARMNGFAVVLSSIYWREAWKYGERAFRYTQHDLGHALAALRFSATICGWNFHVKPEVPSSRLDALLGFEAASGHPGEAERADCLCWVQSGPFTEDPNLMDWLNGLELPELNNEPNQLSPSHEDWPIIDQAARATASPGFSTTPVAPDKPIPHPLSNHSAEAIIRQRRSAQSFDPGHSRISRAGFRQMLAATFPVRNGPFDTLGTGTNMHLVIFVHQVDDLDPGLYCLVRNSVDLEKLRKSMEPTFSWSPIDDYLPLYLLRTGDFRETAKSISCHQPIAGHSAFSLGMLARFDSLLAGKPWIYPRLFWEAGFIGQILYLEAEERGLRGTGIGCYFDDAMHRLLGLGDHYWQDLYHFTVGSALEDKRIQTEPPYSHLSLVRNR